jgi:hypothetical protein
MAVKSLAAQSDTTTLLCPLETMGYKDSARFAPANDNSDVAVVRVEGKVSGWASSHEMSVQ